MTTAERGVDGCSRVDKGIPPKTCSRLQKPENIALVFIVDILTDEGQVLGGVLPST